MRDGFDILAIAFAYLAAAVVIFMFGMMYGREHQCRTMGYEYEKGKCIVVTRTEVKP